MISLENTSQNTAVSLPISPFEVAVIKKNPELNIPATFAAKDRSSIQTSEVVPSDFSIYLDNLENCHLAVVLMFSDNTAEILELLQILRNRPQFSQTRVFLITSISNFSAGIGKDDFDLEDILNPDHLTNIKVLQIIEHGIRAYQALGTNPLISQYYLDSTYNKIFDWFETTKWDWAEVGDLSRIQKHLLTEGEIEILKESAVIEFGTLPGAHNFLREWSDEYSFSSWALSWGAEEARHSLVQCRYLEQLGINVRAKHAMYKREPYPMGDNQAGTLMMNIISECRAAEYYRWLSKLTQEPTLKKIWKLLAQDEARHAKAFFFFCKELCQLGKEHLIEALKMAYIWLADRENGVKHPAGFFYPHSTSTKGLRQAEEYQAGMTDHADSRVLAMIRDIVNDQSIHTVRDVKAYLREMT
jgi:hypothetical protein